MNLSLSDIESIARRLESLKAQFKWGVWRYVLDADEVECTYTHKTEGFELKAIEEEGYPYLTFSQSVSVRPDETEREALQRMLISTLERLDWENTDA